MHAYIPGLAVNAMTVLAPLALARNLEPYKRILGILVSPQTLSLSVSTPYLQLAEPVGSICLRSFRIPEKSLQRAVLSQCHIGGVIIGADQGIDIPVDLIPMLTDSLHKALPPGTLLAQWSQWSACAVPISYKLEEFSVEDSSHTGTRFLQHYLDSLGGVNTFG